MFYKKENEEWLAGNIVKLPSGIVLNSDNKESVDGWEWYDEEPVEYTQWMLQQEQELLR